MDCVAWTLEMPRRPAMRSWATQSTTMAKWGSTFSGTEIGWSSTLNDTGDADTGPNNLQNFPVLTSAILGSGTVVQGTLNSQSGETYRVEFFASPIADVSGFG